MVARFGRWLRESLVGQLTAKFPLEGTQVLMVVGAFAMGAATMGGLQAAGDQAQEQASRGETAVALETVAAANASARETLHARILAAAQRSDTELDQGLKGLEDEVEGGLAGAELDHEVEAVLDHYVAQRMEALDAYRLTFRHERLQLLEIDWSPEQLPLVKARLKALREQVREMSDAFSRDDLDVALSQPSSEERVAELQASQPTNGFVSTLSGLGADSEGGGEAVAVAAVEETPREQVADLTPQDARVGQPVVDLPLGQ